MSNTVTISGVSATDAMGFKVELTHDGLVINQDYTWRYQPVKYDTWDEVEVVAWTANDMIQSQVTFEFCNSSLASFYRLKWTK
jgi:hypothetical protein